MLVVRSDFQFRKTSRYTTIGVSSQALILELGPSPFSSLPYLHNSVVKPCFEVNACVNTLRASDTFSERLSNGRGALFASFHGERAGHHRL